MPHAHAAREPTLTASCTHRYRHSIPYFHRPPPEAWLSADGTKRSLAAPLRESRESLERGGVTYAKFLKMRFHYAFKAQFVEFGCNDNLLDACQVGTHGRGRARREVAQAMGDSRLQDDGRNYI